MKRYDPRNELPAKFFDTLHIGGRAVGASSGSRTTLIDPATEDAVTDVVVASFSDVDLAVEAARTAFDTGPWPQLAPRDRAALVRKLGEAIGEHLSDLKRAWSGLVGGPVMLSDVLVPVVPEIFEYYARLGESFDFTDTRRTHLGHVSVSREPVGVTALITPWNAPLNILAIKLAPALMAGCCVVIKPSPETPVEALLISRLAAEIGFPPGVINVVLGGRDIGEHLVAHPLIDMVSFTGSTRAGIAIAATCAKRMTRTSLELGGKSAAIVLDDARLDDVLSAIVPWSMPFSGQACFAQTRILVPRARAEEITSAYVGAIGSMQVGDPWDSATHLGPVVSAIQQSAIIAAIDGAVEAGAEAQIGGGKHRSFERGFYVEPTVLTGVTRDMSIAREETFGPVVSIISYGDEAEAISIANDTDFGLHGTVFSADTSRAVRVARHIRTGSIGINNFQHDPVAPFGGFKALGPRPRRWA